MKFCIFLILILFRGDNNKLFEFVEPLLKKLRINSEPRRNLIYAIVDIYLGKEKGWTEIAKFCYFKQKKNAKVILDCLLQLANWTEIKNTTEGINIQRMPARKYFINNNQKKCRETQRGYTIDNVRNHKIHC